MKKLLLAALVLTSLFADTEPAIAAPSARTTISRNPNRMERTRRRLRRQAASRMRRNKRQHGA